VIIKCNIYLERLKNLKIEIFRNSQDFVDLLPIFATKEYLQNRSKEYGWFVSKDALLPFYIDRRGVFAKLVFTNETIFFNDSVNETSFLNRVVKKAKELNIDLIAQPLASVVFKNVPENSKYIPWGSYVVDLRHSEDEILQNMHSKHRNVIKKAIKNGVVVKETQDVEIVFENLKNTMKRLNRSYPSFEELKKLKTFSKFYIALKDDIVQGCAVLPYNHLGAFYLYGGSVAKPYTGSLNYMHYFAMLDLKKEGVLKYDFMGARVNVEKGSKLEGIQRFKSRFGGELKRGYLWKYIYSPYKVSMINIIQKVRFKLKGQIYLGDAIEQESSR